MLRVVAAQNRNSPAHVDQKRTHGLIDGTECFHCDRLENERSLLLLLLFIIIIIYLFIYLWINSVIEKWQ